MTRQSTRLRRAISRIVVTGLLASVATLALVPVVVWTAVHRQILECTCSHGEHAVCPMHHKSAPTPELCVMGLSGDLPQAVLTSSFGDVELVRPYAAAVPLESRGRVPFFLPAARSLPQVPPDPPPPRL